MRNGVIGSVVLVSGLLTGGCGKQPDTTGVATRPEEATPDVEKEAQAAHKATPAAGQAITNSIGMKLVLIPAGEFMMGRRESAERNWSKPGFACFDFGFRVARTP